MWTLLCKLWLYFTLALHPADQHVLNYITIITFFGGKFKFFTNLCDYIMQYNCICVTAKLQLASSYTWQLMRLIQHFYLNVTISHYWVSVITSDCDPMWILVKWWGEDTRKIHSYNFCGAWRKSNITSSVSESHSHCRQPQSPDPRQLSFDHLQLLSLINTPTNSTRSLTLIVRSTVHHTEQYLTSFALTCVFLPFRLSSDSPVFTPGLRVLQRFSSVDSRSPQCPDFIPLWTISISVLAQIHRRYLFTRYSPARHSSLFQQFPQ